MIIGGALWVEELRDALRRKEAPLHGLEWLDWPVVSGLIGLALLECGCGRIDGGFVLLAFVSGLKYVEELMGERIESDRGETDGVKELGSVGIDAPAMYRQVNEGQLRPPDRRRADGRSGVCARIGMRALGWLRASMLSVAPARAYAVGCLVGVALSCSTVSVGVWPRVGWKIGSGLVLRLGLRTRRMSGRVGGVKYY